MASKTEVVRSRIFEAILHGDYAPGTAVPSERDMTRMTRTSRVTVRRAYAALEEAGILQKRQGRGAFISTMPQGNSRGPRTIAVLASLNDLFALEFIAALERAAARHDALLILRQTDQDPIREAAGALALVQQGVRNIVVWASGDRYDARLFARLRILGVNLVFFDRMRPGNFADFVGTDHAHAIRSLLDQARTRGCREFLLVGYAGITWDSFQEREAAFLEYCRKKRWPARVVRVPWSDQAARLLHGRSRDIVPMLAREPATRVLRRNAPAWFTHPTRQALVGVNDYLAIQLKLVAPHMTVLGIDGLPEATRRGIVTYAHPMGAMAEAAMKLLLDQQHVGRAWRAEIHRLPGQLVLPENARAAKKIRSASQQCTCNPTHLEGHPA